MTHPLTTIRQAAVRTLQPKFRHVYATRTPDPAQIQTPCVAVYLSNRQTTQEGLDLLRHTVRLTVEICVQANQNADELAEKMLGEVEQLFAQNPTLGLPNGTIEELMPTLLTVDRETSGERDTLFYQQIFQILYFESSDQPTA